MIILSIVAKVTCFAKINLVMAVCTICANSEIFALSYLIWTIFSENEAVEDIVDE
jgi:hypothetical protein